MTGSLRSIAACAALAAPLAHAGELPFHVRTLAGSGRTVAAELADLDGDGRQDLLCVVIHDLPPEERRELQLRLQREDGGFDDEPDGTFALPEAAAFDLAAVDDTPGVELLLLQPTGLGLLSFERAADAIALRWRTLPVPGGRTLGAGVDERGIDRLRIASDAFDSRPWLIVPGLDETFFLAPDGELEARIDSGARANYFVQPPGPMLGESDIQIFLDAPRISVGDVDGDGRADIVASSRHELRLFHRREDGSYPRAPDVVVPLRRVSLEDHIRGSGSVRSTARDIDGDGLLDLLLSLTVGGVMKASSDTYVFLNRGGRWDLDHPDASFESEKTLAADQLIDLDGDGGVELVRIGIPIGVLELVEIFVQRALDARLEAYRIEPAVAGTEGEPPPPKPLFVQDLDVPLDLETSRLAAFLPTVEHDVNGDGRVDYLSGADGTRLEVYLGRPEGGFEKRAEQEFPTEGQIRAGDVNADGLPDFVFSNSRRVDEPVRIITNRGVLPGTPERTLIEAAGE